MGGYKRALRSKDRPPKCAGMRRVNSPIMRSCHCFIYLYNFLLEYLVCLNFLYKILMIITKITVIFNIIDTINKLGNNIIPFIKLEIINMIIPYLIFLFLIYSIILIIVNIIESIVINNNIFFIKLFTEKCAVIYMAVDKSDLLVTANAVLSSALFFEILYLQ